MINHIFQAGNGIGNRSEQDLLESINAEAIQIAGIEMYYLPRTLNKLDKLFLEDTLSSFVKCYPIEMYMENVNGFDGQDMMAKFGLSFNSSATLLVSRMRWQDAVGRSGEVMLPNRPCEGDLIYFPLTRSMFEIKKADIFNSFYELGKLYNYKLTVELFQYSAELIDTKVPEIDNVRFPFGNMDEESYALLDEYGVDMLDENGKSLTGNDYTMETVNAQSDNDYFQENNTNVIQFDVNNPFGNIME